MLALPPYQGSEAMAHFKLVPVHKLLRSIDFDAVSAASILNIASRSPLGETDVYCNGSYRCTVNHGRAGVWTFTQLKTALRYDGAAGRSGITIRVYPDTQFDRQAEFACDP